MENNLKGLILNEDEKKEKVLLKELKFDEEETFESFYKYPSMVFFGVGSSWVRILHSRHPLSNCSNTVCHIHGVRDLHFRVPNDTFIKYQYQDMGDTYFETIIEDENFPYVEFNIGGSYWHCWMNVLDLIIRKESKLD